MPLINLVQEQRLAIKRDMTKARSFFLMFGAAAAGSILGFGFLTFKTADAHATEAKLRADKQKLAPLEKQIDSDTKASADLEPRLTTLESAQDLTGKWARLLDHIAHQTPEDTWLTGVRTVSNDPTKPITAQFTGQALSQTPISEFVLRLENSTDVENVSLKYTQEKANASTKSTEFEVDADIVGTAAKKPDAKSGDAKTS